MSTPLLSTAVLAICFACHSDQIRARETSTAPEQNAAITCVAPLFSEPGETNLPEGSQQELTRITLDTPLHSASPFIGICILPEKRKAHIDDESFIDQPVCLLSPGSDDNQIGNSTQTPLKLLRHQPLITLPMFVFFGASRVISQDIHTASLIHALITAPIGVYLYSTKNQSASEIATGLPSYEHSLSTSSVLILQAYSAYEILDSTYAATPQYLLHGLTIFAACAASSQLGKLGLLTTGMVMETSQIFYNAGMLYKTHYLPEGAPRPLAFFVPFVITFFGSRWIVFSYEYYKFIRDSFLNAEEYSKEPFLISTVTAGGAVMSSLNLLWGVKILNGIIKRFKSQ